MTNKTVEHDRQLFDLCESVADCAIESFNELANDETPLSQVLAIRFAIQFLSLKEAGFCLSPDDDDDSAERRYDRAAKRIEQAATSECSVPVSLETIREILRYTRPEKVGPP